MATTTAKAFDEFSAKVPPTDTQRETIKGRLATTKGYLADTFGPNSDMPLSSTSVIGSAGRNTIIRPIDDIDVLAVFGNAQAVYSKYTSDSRKFLYRVRDALDGYQVKVVGARGQAVRLFYTSAPNVDIAPVLPLTGGGYYLLAGDGTWISTNPDRHESWLNERNEARSYNLKPFIRMARRWNREHSRHFKPFHLEVVTAKAFSTLGTNYRQAAHLFFKWAKTNIGASDPAYPTVSLDSYMPWNSTRRANAVAALEAAETRAGKALQAEGDGDHQEAIRLWRIVFGDEFPAYG